MNLTVNDCLGKAGQDKLPAAFFTKIYPATHSLQSVFHTDEDVSPSRGVYILYSSLQLLYLNSSYLCFSAATTLRMKEMSLFSHEATSEGGTKARLMICLYTRVLCVTIFKKSIWQRRRRATSHKSITQ